MALTINARLSPASRAAIQLGLVAATVAFVRAIIHHAPPHVLVEAPALAFTIFFLLVRIGTSFRDLGLIRDHLEVSPWFALLVAGGFAAFWIGAIAFESLARGWYTVLGWVVILATAWLVVRLWRRFGRGP